MPKTDKKWLKLTESLIGWNRLILKGVNN